MIRDQNMEFSLFDLFIIVLAEFNGIYSILMEYKYIQKYLTK